MVTATLTVHLRNFTREKGRVTGTSMSVLNRWRNCGLGVERSLLDPKVVGSNPGGAEIGLHDFHDPQKRARILVQLSRKQSSRVA